MQCMQFDAAVTVAKNRRGGGRSHARVNTLWATKKTLRRLLSDRKSKDCPAVYQATATERHLTSERRAAMAPRMRQSAKPFSTPTSIFTVIYGEHINHE